MATFLHQRAYVSSLPLDRRDGAQTANRTPGVPGWASGPATTSNSAFSGAGPSQARRSRSAFSDGHGTGRRDR